MPDDTALTPPYTVESLPYGGHLMPTRKLPGGGYGPILTADEIAMWEHVQKLTAERDALAAKVAELTVTLTEMQDAMYDNAPGVEVPAEEPKAKPARKGK